MTINFVMDQHLQSELSSLGYKVTWSMLIISYIQHVSFPKIAWSGVVFDCIDS